MRYRWTVELIGVLPMRNILRVCGLVAVFGVVGCGSDEDGAAEAPAEAPAAETMKPDVTLTNTYWKLVELNGAAVLPGEDKELHMILSGDDQVGGYAGCNQFTGSVTVTGDGSVVRTDREHAPDVCGGHAAGRRVSAGPRERAAFRDLRRRSGDRRRKW